ncbi:helix-turn-helix transcriptional regulator [Streptomyces sp. NPDC052107]|uniref:helix-turn-helix domain-containing protein n=1 Tax=Streptomyces sp. NPDC052107 TaxID=3155632 RepID=UPI003447B056
MQPRQPEFGRRLKQLRLAAGLKQIDLTSASVSPSYISKLESGARLPSPDVVGYLAARLNIPVEHLLQEEPPGRADAHEIVQAEAAIALKAGDFERVAELLQPMEEAATTMADWQLLWMLSIAYESLGRLEEQADCLRRLADVADTAAADHVRASALTELAGVQRVLGNLTESLATAQQAVALVRQSPASLPQLKLRSVMALMASETEAGLVSQAGGRVPGLLAQVGDVSGQLQAKALWASASVRVRQGMAAEGMQLMRHALATLNSRDDLLSWARLRVAAASLQLRVTGSPTEEVRGWLDEAAPALCLVGHDIHAAELRAVWARIHFLDEDFAEAVEQAEEALKRDALAYQDRARTRLLLAAAMVGLGDRGPGLELMERVAREAESAGFLDVAAEAWKALATSSRNHPRD